MSLSLKSESESVFRPLPPSATFAEREAYHLEHQLPGPVDRWLTANSRSPHVAFLQNYLMLDDVNGVSCVVCNIESVCTKVYLA